MEVKIVDFPETKVAMIEHRGATELEYETAKKLIAWRIENRVPPDKHRSYGVHYHDPRTTPADEYRVDFCVSYDEEVKENQYGVFRGVIPGCRCAVARHHGSREDIVAARYLFETWLPQSTESLGDFPVFFHYVNVGPHVQPDDMITDVYLPLK